MSAVTTNQPLGTPTWIDLGIPDLDRAMAFYGSALGWEFVSDPWECTRWRPRRSGTGSFRYAESRWIPASVSPNLSAAISSS